MENKFKRGDIVERTCECCRGDRLKVLGYNDEGMVVYEMNDSDGCAFEDELRLIGQHGNPI